MNDAIKGKVLKCEMLIEQAVNDTKEQFANSPDRDARILDTVMDALSACASTSKQALESEMGRVKSSWLMIRRS